MRKFIDVALGDMFKPTSGSARYILEYIDRNPGENPVYSASLRAPFGMISRHDHEGHYLTWVMNGYGGRVQEVKGRFSLTRDRGVFIPHGGVRIPDLTYLRFVAEPQLMAAAVGRIVEGKKNHYTKIYKDVAGDVTVPIPVTDEGEFDHNLMTELGEKLRRIELARLGVEQIAESIESATFPVDMPEPNISISLGDGTYFAISIGERVTKEGTKPEGVTVYSANTRVPFGLIPASNLSDFSRPSILWGIDWIFNVNFIEAGVPFATTDHCGRVQVLSEDVDPEYVYWFMFFTRGRYGYDRVYRASLGNVSSDVMVTFPVDPATGRPDLEAQRSMVSDMKRKELARSATLEALKQVRGVRIRVEDLAP